jgi:hypothetical protein
LGEFNSCGEGIEAWKEKMGDMVGFDRQLLIATLSPRAGMSGIRKSIRVQQGCIGSSGTDHKFVESWI